VAPGRLHEEDILEADRPMIEALVAISAAAGRPSAD
jgi:hypothetical protein